MPEQPVVRHTFRNVLLTLLAVVFLSVGIWMGVPPDARKAPDATSVPANSMPVVAGIGGDFRLPASTGGELGLADLRGKVVLLNFGFTNCPDVCPMVLTRLGNTLRAMDGSGLVDMTRVQPVFVTFDPARDTLEHLREYVTFFHPSLIALRGDEAQTVALAKQYKVIYLKQQSDSASGYVYQHSDFVYVIDTLGRVRLLVSSKDPDAAISEAVKKLLREADAK